MNRIVIALMLALVTPASALAAPEYPSAEWTQRELENYARTLEAPIEQVTQPAFLLRLSTQSVANIGDFTLRTVLDPSWLLAGSPLATLLGGLTAPTEIPQIIAGIAEQLREDPASAIAINLNTPVTPLCATNALQCAGDPFRYPVVDAFYGSEGDREAVVYYDRDCARISGHVWKPAAATGPLPTVVIENGSIQAPEPLYWWFAQTLVRNGYTVMTFDPRGQGRSDQQTPLFQQGSNLNSAVFWEGLVDAIDFFRSTPEIPYPRNAECAGTYPTAVTAHNPYHHVQDRSRLGLAGHSLGGTGVSVVQSYGAPGAEPWPGLIDEQNPVDVIVAWDSLSAPREGGEGVPAIVPRVPAMGQTSEYGILGGPNTAPPDPEGHKRAYRGWVAAGLPVYQFTIRGSTHFEWSQIPTFPSTSWCPNAASGECSGGWGQPMADHYSLAWLDRWLKQPGEPGFDDADARLLADADWIERYSFYSASARDFPKRSGGRAVCEDILAGCSAAGGGSSSGGAISPLLLLGFGLALLAGRGRRSTIR
jgi:hypothetical protein